MISGEKESGDSLREKLYPPQPDPRMMTRSRFMSDCAIAVEWPTCAANASLLVENRALCTWSWCKPAHRDSGRLNASSVISKPY